MVCGGGASELRCAAFSCDLRAGSHDASAVDSYGSVVPFLVGLGGGLFYGRFLLGYRVSSLAGSFALIYLSIYQVTRWKTSRLSREPTEAAGKRCSS